MTYAWNRMREVREEQKESLEYLQEVVTWMGEYKHAIKKCAEAGVTNVRMAHTIGITETAVRMYRQRHGI